MRVGTQHALLRRIVEAAEIDTVVDTRLVVDSTTTSARKAHENNVIGTMNILAACSGAGLDGRKFVFKSSAHYYGCRAGRPGVLHRVDGPPAPAAHADRARHRRGRGVASRDFTEKQPDVDGDACCASRTCSGPDVDTSHIGLFSLPVRAR